MRTQLIVLLALAIALASNAEGQVIQDQIKSPGFTVVSPNVYENAEAPSDSGRFNPLRAVGIYSSSEFAAVPPGGAAITALSLRPDGTAPQGVTGSVSHLTLSLSVTQADPSDISTTFDDNITGTPVVVYDAPWTVTITSDIPTGPDTRPFDSRIPFDTPYFYDPAAGNLVVDWRMDVAPGEPRVRWDNDLVNVLLARTMFLAGLVILRVEEVFAWLLNSLSFLSPPRSVLRG